MADTFKAKYPGTCGICHRKFPGGTWVRKIEPVKMRRFSHFSNARNVYRGENAVYETFTTNRAHDSCVELAAVREQVEKLEADRIKLGYENGRLSRELEAANRQLEQMELLRGRVDKLADDRIWLKRDVNAYRRQLRRAGMDDA